VPTLRTMIATQPDQTTSIADPADVAALATVRARLEAAASVPANDHELIEVSSLGDIAARLRARPVQPGEHLQLVGHGMPGMLALGYLWTGVYATTHDVYALDSNLFWHQMLDGLVDPNATVAIIGCAVGEDRVGPGQHDGPTLVFDLARLWSCAVSAPVGTVTPDDFDDTGRYARPSQLVIAHDRAVSPRPTPPPIVVEPETEQLAPIVDVHAMRMLGRHENEQRRGRARTGLSGTRLAVHPYRGELAPLALPELVLELADHTVVTVLAGASLLRIQHDDDVHYGVPAVDSALAARIWQAAVAGPTEA
jgi:hypothetical protein